MFLQVSVSTERYPQLCGPRSLPQPLVPCPFPGLGYPPPFSQDRTGVSLSQDRNGVPLLTARGGLGYSPLCKDWVTVHTQARTEVYPPPGLVMPWAVCLLRFPTGWSGPIRQVWQIFYGKSVTRARGSLLFKPTNNIFTAFICNASNGLHSMYHWSRLIHLTWTKKKLTLKGRTKKTRIVFMICKMVWFIILKMFDCRSLKRHHRHLLFANPYIRYTI